MGKQNSEISVGIRLCFESSCTHVTETIDCPGRDRAGNDISGYDYTITGNRLEALNVNLKLAGLTFNFN